MSVTRVSNPPPFSYNGVKTGSFTEVYEDSDTPGTQAVVVLFTPSSNSSLLGSSIPKFGPLEFGVSSPKPPTSFSGRRRSRASPAAPGPTTPTLERRKASSSFDVSDAPPNSPRSCRGRELVRREASSQIHSGEGKCDKTEKWQTRPSRTGLSGNPVSQGHLGTPLELQGLLTHEVIVNLRVAQGLSAQRSRQGSGVPSVRSRRGVTEDVVVREELVETPKPKTLPVPFLSSFRHFLAPRTDVSGGAHARNQPISADRAVRGDAP